MSLVENLEKAGYKVEKSEAGGKPIFEGVYKATFFDFAKMEDKGYGESLYAQFKIVEALDGRESNSQFPEFKDYYSLTPENISSKRKGLAKLLNGLFSVGVEIDKSTDDALMKALGNAKGTEVFISAYKKQPRKQVGEKWVADMDKDVRQAFTFMTEKNAVKKIEKVKKLATPF